MCDRAETGSCDSFSYFSFSGDHGTRELRWFDKKGNLVGQRSTTYSKNFCNGMARTIFKGDIPKCKSSKPTELICGNAEKKLQNALEDLRRINLNDYR